MLDTIRRLGTETAIYGVSTILGRFLNFLLVPFYTNVLLPNEYGLATYIFSLIAFMNVIYGYGMESAYFSHSARRETGTLQQNFSTPFISLFMTSSVFSLMIVLGSSSLGEMIQISRHHTRMIDYACWILFFDTMAIVPFASLRMEHKARYFAALKFFNIIVNVGANLVFLLVYNMGVEGIFLSNLLASAATFFLLVPTVIRQFTTDFSPALYREILRFGLPYVPAGLAAMMIQVIDRPILRILTDDATVGVYQANYRLGIFMMLVVQMFDYAWRPFFFSHAGDPNARQTFARILTYFVLLMSAIFLLLTFFIPDLVQVELFGRHIIHPSYWGALDIVPVVLLAYLFLGIFNTLVAGVYIEKKTRYLPWITFAGAAVKVLANFLLIPEWGALGAAWATYFSYFTMVVVVFLVGRRIYPMPLEWNRLGKVAISCALPAALYFAVPVAGVAWLWKSGLIVLFGASVYVMKFFDKEELGLIGSLFSRQSQPDQPSPETVSPF